MVVVRGICYTVGGIPAIVMMGLLKESPMPLVNSVRKTLARMFYLPSTMPSMCVYVYTHVCVNVCVCVCVCVCECVCVCVCVPCIHTFINTCIIHTNIHTHMKPGIYVCMHINIYIYIL